MSGGSQGWFAGARVELELLVGDGRDAGGVVELRSAFELRLRRYEGWSELVMCVGSGCSGFCRQ